MFNPYMAEPREALRPAPGPGRPDPLGGLLERLGRLDSDDLLLLLLIYLVAKQGEDKGSVWPLAAVLLYLIL